MLEKNGNTADKTITIVSGHEADVGIGIPHVEHPPVYAFSNYAVFSCSSMYPSVSPNPIQPSRRDTPHA